MDWTELAQDRDRWRTIVIAVIVFACSGSGNTLQRTICPSVIVGFTNLNSL